MIMSFTGKAAKPRDALPLASGGQPGDGAGLAGVQTKLAAYNSFEGITLENCHRSIAAWLVVDKRPFRVVESDRFKDVCKRISSGRYAPPTYKTLMKHIDAMEANAQVRLARCFEGALPGTFTLTLDAWTSR